MFALGLGVAFSDCRAEQIQCWSHLFHLWEQTRKLTWQPAPQISNPNASCNVLTYMNKVQCLVFTCSHTLGRLMTCKLQWLQPLTNTYWYYYYFTDLVFYKPFFFLFDNPLSVYFLSIDRRLRLRKRVSHLPKLILKVNKMAEPKFELKPLWLQSHSNRHAEDRDGTRPESPLPAWGPSQGIPVSQHPSSFASACV